MSPDLTRNDKAKQGKSGGAITTDITGVEVYDTIFAVAPSPHEKGVIWAGTDDGLVQVTRDDGKTWQNVTPGGIPEWIQVNAIEVSPHEKGGAYVAATMYKFDDFKPYLFKTSDYGKTWTKIVNGIPEGAFTRVVREDPARRGLLFAGTETGLYLSFDDGATWRQFQRNLPATPITDLAIKNGDLVVATQGRSFWILDDLTPLRLWNDRIEQSEAFLFPPRSAHRVQADKPSEDEDPPKGVGTNMPNGVLVNYWLKQKPGKDEIVKIEILSGDKVIRTFSSEKKEPEGDLKEQAEKKELEKDKDKPLEVKRGLNRFLWDMRVFRPTLAPKAVFNEGTKAPPRVGPGKYAVRVTAGKRSFSESVEVLPHPQGPATAEDLKAQFDLLSSIRDSLSETHETVLKVRDARDLAKELGERAERLGKGEALKKRAAALAEKLTAVELELTNPEIKADEDDLNYEPRLDHDWVNLAGIVASADRKPTAGSVRMYGELKAKLDGIVKEYQALMEKDVAEFNRAAEEAKLPRVAPAPKIEK